MTAAATALVERASARAQAAGTHGTTLLCLASQLITELGTVTAQAVEVTDRSGIIATQGAHTADVSAQMRALIAEARELYRTLESSSAGLRSVQTELANIARETHIVALNAMIEAARVGDAGAPFSVVAKEVQLLARKASDASSAIEARTGMIASSIAEGASIMGRLDEGVARVDAASGVVADAARTQHVMLEQLSAGVATVCSGLDDAVNGAMSDLTEEAMTLQGELAELSATIDSMGQPGAVSGQITEAAPPGSNGSGDDAASSDQVDDLATDVAA